MPLCDLCEDEEAIVTCPECEMNLCGADGADCDADIHNDPKLSTHVRHKVGQPPAAAAAAAVAAPVAAPTPVTASAPAPAAAANAVSAAAQADVAAELARQKVALDKNYAAEKTQLVSAHQAEMQSLQQAFEKERASFREQVAAAKESGSSADQVKSAVDAALAEAKVSSDEKLASVQKKLASKQEELVTVLGREHDMKEHVEVLTASAAAAHSIEDELKKAVEESKKELEACRRSLVVAVAGEVLS